MTVNSRLHAATRAQRYATVASAAVLLVISASVDNAIAAVDCTPSLVPHNTSAKHRSHHRRPTVTHPGKRPKAPPAKRASGHECHPVVVTLADINTLGSPVDDGPLGQFASVAPDPDSPNPTAPPHFQLASFAVPLSHVSGDDLGGTGSGTGGSGGGGSGGGGGPGGGGPGGGGPGGGGPRDGSPGGGGPGGGPYTPPPGGGPPPPGTGSPPGGGGMPGVPEPATWTMMLVGFGAAGAVVRGRRGSARA